VSEKTCNKCGLTKQLSDFPTDRSKPGGTSSQCRDCRKAYFKQFNADNKERRYGQTKEWSQNNRDKRNASSRAYYASHKHEHLVRVRRYRGSNTLASKAHGKVTYAIRTGVLIPQPCEICGCQDVQAHHEDYSKPLDVKWLCVKHHKLVHVAKT
jgi:hypothetical protein